MACFPVYKGVKYNSIEELRDKNKPKIDKELLKIIGYRIPNQKLSSNQPLEVVGILPPEMGDSIMMYSEITTQTGSDFDIDKTYVMMPAFDVEYSNKKDLIDTLFKMDETELFAMIESFSDFDEYKENNPLPKEKVNNRGTQKRRTIDYLMDRGLIPENLSQKYVKGLRYVKPIVQEVLETQEQVQTSEKIYNQLGNKTQSENVVIKSWSELKDATKAITSQGIVSTRIKMSTGHFGNPFTSNPKLQGLIQTESTEESVKRYINWILTGETGEVVFTGIQPEELEIQREWILEQLESGKLKNKPILYYKDLREPSHATALDYLINKYDWNQKQPIEQETVSTIEIKPGVEELFNENPELTTIGTTEQYSQYLDTIFPNSQVKDIVYHSRFTVSNIKNKSRWKNGFYSGTKDQADLMADMAENSSGLMTTSALLINMQNPKVTNYTDRKVENYKNTNDGFIIEATEKDALVLIGDRDGYNVENFKKEYVVFEPEQIHILGSKQDIEGFKEFVDKSKTTEETKSEDTAKVTSKVPSKKELQNELFELYYKVLSSPLSYADMMSGIDGSVIKDTIEDLHGSKDKLTSLQLLDPTYQLQIKFDNIVGKSGVGVTANQLVDHVFNQMAGVEMKAKSLRYFSKYLNTTNHGIDLSQIFDIEGNKISDSVSMFLNAFVDIAKDAYITRGNFNVHTLNPTFLLLRGGMPIKQVIAYMGQPILKDAIKVFQSKLSSLDKIENKTELLNNSLKEVTYDLEQKIDNIITKSGALVDTNAKTSAFSYKTLAGTIKNKEYYEGLIQMYSNPNRMEAMKKENYEEFVKNINSLIGYKNFQVKVADSYKALHKDGELLSEQVLTSKSDVNGGGHDIATHFSNNNRFNKVRDSGVFKNFDVKFDSDTMLGAKTLYTLRYFSSLDENLFITMHPNIKPIYNMVSRLIKGDDYASNVNTIKKVEQSMYGTLVHKALEKTPYEITKKDIERLFFPGDGIAEKIVNLKLNPKYVNNKLIQNLETFKEDNMTFLSADNFVRKPDSVLTDLSNAWSELLNSEDKLDKEIAIDLVKYAIATSGLAKNRHSIFEFMPIEVADYLDRGIAKMKSEGISDIFTNFIENFLRHVQNESYLPKVQMKILTAKGGNMSEKELEKVFGLVNVDPRVVFIKKNHVSNLPKEIQDLRINEMNKLKHYKIVNIGSSVYEYVGDITSLDGKGDIMILAPSYRLGRQFGNKGTQEVANANIYEYGTKETMFKENLPGKYESIKQTLDVVKENLPFEEHTFNLEGTLQYYGKNIQVMDYNGKAAYAELVKRGIVKENKC